MGVGDRASPASMGGAMPAIGQLPSSTFKKRSDVLEEETLNSGV
jgi:hypothetical protein